ncbi:Altered inheritance of mitochondria protein 41, mitochondrial [Nakaseomyces bracarensis]|uniref:Altered inheritance of mitochondria protein 41 n=1 Tax=Nakaseomyces bracarensis TaxID=273131 RepID=A0ABR4NXL4_9SACH
MYRVSSRAFGGALRFGHYNGIRYNGVRYNSVYSTLMTTLKQDMKDAMVKKDQLRKTAIKSIMSTIKNSEIDMKNKELDAFALHDAFTKMVQQRTDSVKDYVANKRQDLADKENQEIEVISKYLKDIPVASKEDIEKKVVEFLEELKKSEPDLQLKQIFSKFDWDKITNEWKASQKAIRAAIVSQFKTIFK